MLIFNDSNWDPLTLSKDDFALSSTLNLFNIDTWEGDLSAFQDKGGKLLHYHGQTDGIITSENSPNITPYLRRWAWRQKILTISIASSVFWHATLGSGGPGASVIGNGGLLPGGQSGTRGERIDGYGALGRRGHCSRRHYRHSYVNETQSNGVDYKRRHCRWPSRNVYLGPGSDKDMDNWGCIL